MKIAIVGAGGHGRVVLDIVRNNHQFEVVGFLDANTSLRGQTVDDLPVLGDMSRVPDLAKLGIGAVIIAIGDNQVRRSYAGAFERARISLVSAIHPSASIADNAQVGKNVVIAAGANVCAHVIIGDSAILNTGCIVDHESRICTGAHVCPGVRLAGHVLVKESAFVGIGATVIQGVTIGESAVVGAGAVVLEDVPAYATVVGVPARSVRASHMRDAAGKRTASGGEQGETSTADLEPARSMVRPQRRRPTVRPEEEVLVGAVSR